MTCQVCAHDCCRAEPQLRVGQRTRTRRTACGRERLRRWIHLIFAGSRQSSLRRGAASLYGRRSLHQALLSAVEGSPGRLSFQSAVLLVLPCEAAARSRQPKSLSLPLAGSSSSSAASHRPRIRCLLAAGRVLSRARVTAAKRTLDRFRPVAYDVNRGRWRSPWRSPCRPSPWRSPWRSPCRPSPWRSPCRSPCRSPWRSPCRPSPCRPSRAFSKHSIPVSPVVFGSVRSRLPR